MIRIFTTLALFAVAVLAVTMGLGLFIGDLHDPANYRDPHVVRLAIVHKMFGLAAALSVVLVNSIVVTYFVGTSRWCKEVVETYQLDRRLLARSVRLKRRTFPWAISAMLAAVVMGALAPPPIPAGFIPEPKIGFIRTCSARSPDLHSFSMRFFWKPCESASIMRSSPISWPKCDGFAPSADWKFRFSCAPAFNGSALHR